MSEFNKEIVMSITDLKNQILATEDRNKILTYTNELYSIVNNPDNKCNNDFRKETLLLFLEREINNLRNNVGDIKSAHSEAIFIYQSLLGIYLEYHDRVEFLRDLEIKQH